MPGASTSINHKSTYVLGVDVNRRGMDETALVVLEQIPYAAENTGLYVSYIETSNSSDLSATVGRVLYLHSLFNFRKIYVDTTGIGAGVTDMLKSRIGGGVVEDVIFSRTSKPDMFNNLKLLMQQNRLKIPNFYDNNDDRCRKLFYQLLAIEQEFSEKSEIPLISHAEGTHDDTVCALALAALFFRVGRKGKHSYNFSGFNNS